MHQSLQGATFHVEHIIPVSEGGSDDLENLCLACPSCNLQKSNRVEIIDSQTLSATTIFHPILEDWNQHFEWSETLLLGLTATGRATVEILKLNSERRQRIRSFEGIIGLFPPDD
jgi:hypothetical protein